MIRKIIGDETGATAIEYGLIAALVAIVLVGALTSIGTSLSSIFDTAATTIDAAKTP